MKNIIFLHLESFSQLAFGHREWFPNLNRLYNHSTRLSRYFSAATSSDMTFCDVVYGDDRLFEHNIGVEGMALHESDHDKSSIFDILIEHDYRVAGITCPDYMTIQGTNLPLEDHTLARSSRLWSSKNAIDIKNVNSYPLMMEETSRFISDKSGPFALYLWNLCSHISYMDRYKSRADNGLECYHKGLQSLDKTVGHLIQILIEQGQLDNTIIIGFGDHGDDYWTHGLKGGFSHVIEPYTTVTHTPAFIWQNETRGKDWDSLCSSVDLGITALNLLNIRNTDLSNHGVDIFTQGREYCYSRNLFVGQSNTRFGGAVKKGHSLTSDSLHLMKVLGCYSLYNYLADPGCHFDLLSLFALDDGKLTYVPEIALRKEVLRSSNLYWNTFHRHDGTIDFIIENFYKMRDQLNDMINTSKEFANQRGVA